MVEHEEDESPVFDAREEFTEEVEPRLNALWHEFKDRDLITFFCAVLANEPHPDGGNVCGVQVASTSRTDRWAPPQIIALRLVVEHPEIAQVIIHFLPILKAVGRMDVEVWEQIAQIFPQIPEENADLEVLRRFLEGLGGSEDDA